MPTYGSFRYGTRDYGVIPASTTRSYLLAQVVDYRTVKVTIEATGRLGSGYVLLRSRNGAAEDPSDGLIIATGEISSGRFTVTDGVTNLADSDLHNDVAVPDGMVYYTIYVFDEEGVWSKDASTSVLVPRERGTLATMLGILPLFYVSEENNPTDPVTFDSDLARFMNGLALTYDELVSAIDNIIPENRDRNVIRRMHDAFATGVGMPNEYTIGVGANARLFREAGYIYRNKGTVQAVATYAEALTGWQTDVVESTNLLLELDDATFETGVGSWGGAVDCGITRVPIDGVTVLAPPFAYEDGNEGHAMSAVGRITLTGAASKIFLPATADRLKMIPIEGGRTYHVNVPMIKRSGTLSTNIRMRWYDYTGKYISDTSLISESLGTGWNTHSDEVIAPDLARFAQLEVRVSGANTNAYDMKMISITKDLDGPYRDPRQVTVICQPNRINLLHDPSFDAISSPWVEEVGNFVTSTEEVLYTGRAAKLTEVEWSIRSNVIPVVGSFPYAVSAYAFGDDTDANVEIVWYNEANEEIVTNGMSWGDLTEAWKRLDYTAVSPADADHCVVRFLGGGTTYIDASIFERADRPQVFFSGSTADSLTQDSLWSTDDPAESYSLLYANRLVKVSRLKATLPYYLPYGVTARVLLWDSQDADVLNLIPLGVSPSVYGDTYTLLY